MDGHGRLLTQLVALCRERPWWAIVFAIVRPRSASGKSHSVKPEVRWLVLLVPWCHMKEAEIHQMRYGILYF
jgi:hypothetical protein